MFPSVLYYGHFEGGNSAVMMICSYYVYTCLKYIFGLVLEISATLVCHLFLLYLVFI